MRFLLSIFIILTMYPACQTSSSVPVYLPSETQLNVPYGKDSLQVMDIYLPAGRSAASTPVLVLIHGGGWNGGNKSEFNSYIDSFKKRMPDYALFNLNYRLYNGNNRFPAQEEDIRAALNLIAGSDKKYQVSKQKMVVLGASAGGHLALLQAYKYKEPGIKAVIDFFGPTDLTAMYQQSWHPLVPYALQLITGTVPALNPNIYRESSPANYVSPDVPPTLIFHGAKDNIVDVSQSKSLQNALKKNRVAHDLVIYPAERHGWRGKTLSHSFDRIEAFLKEHVPE